MKPARAGAARLGPSTLAGLLIGALLLHAGSLGTWIVDDAGISFAYARNLAAGHGLVAQPSAAPVEGFSNPLWVLTCAALERTGLFDPLWSPKLLSLVLVAAAVVLLVRALRAALGPATTLVGLALLVLQPGFAIWIASGLENGLQVALVITAAVVALRAFGSGAVGAAVPRGEVASSGEAPAPRAATVPLLCGSLVAGLCALCRPEGLAWAALVPALALGQGLRGRALGRVLALHATLLVPLVAGWLTFRILYFGDWVPNTFHAKGGGTLGTALTATAGIAGLAVAVAFARRRLAGRALGLSAGPWLLLFAVLLWLPRLDRLAAAFGGRLGLVLGALLLLGAARRAGPLDPARRLLLIATALGAWVHQALPRDWMGEYRFATAFFPFACMALTCFVPEALRGFGRGPATVFVTACLAVVGVDAVRCGLAFHADPTVPLALVRERTQQPIERLRAVAGPGLASVWTPDLGAMLLWSSLRVHDLAGLCDRELALALQRGPAAARAVVLGRGADLITIHGFFADALRLGDDPGFARDWRGIEEYVPDAALPGRIEGVFVRRDLAPDETTLADLRRAWRGGSEPR